MDGGLWVGLTSGWTTSASQVLTPPIVGVYDIAVWARSAGSNVDAPQAYAERRYETVP